MSAALFKVKQGYRIEVGSDYVDQLFGTADPTAGGGVVAPLGSIYQRSNGELWHKTGSGATDWTKLLDSAGASLEDGYQNAFTGKSSTGDLMPEYTEENHIIDGDDLEEAIDKLDIYIGEDPIPEDRSNHPIANPTAGYQEFGLSGIVAGNNSTLADATYKFKIAVDGGSIVEKSITVAGGPITNTALMALINAQLGAAAAITIAVDDFRITSSDFGATSSISLTSGGAVDLFGVSGLNTTPDAAVQGTDAGTVNQNISSLDAAIGSDADMVSQEVIDENDTINANLSALDAELKARNPYKISLTNQDCDPAKTVDTLVLANYWSALWKITVRENGTPANIYSSMINCVWAGATLDYDEFAILELGSKIDGLSIEPKKVDSNIELQITADNNLDIRVERIVQ